MRIVALSIFLLLGTGYVWSSARAGSQSPEKKTGLSAEQLARARTLFGDRCARCHGPDGRGETIIGDMLDVPDFTDSKWWKDHGHDKDLIKSITNGNGDMPAFAKKLAKPEIALLADYIRGFNQE